MFTLDAIIGSLPRSLEVLDIGARLEEPPRYSPLVARDMANVTAVEPQAADRERLTQSFGAARMRCLPHVLGDGRLSTLHVTRHPGCTSLFAPGRCYRPLTAGSPTTPVSQPLWCDMVFVRDPSRLERWSDPDLLRGATLLHDLYHSYDLVNRLLAEHDRRAGSEHAVRYRTMLQGEGSVPVSFITVGHGP